MRSGLHMDSIAIGIAWCVAWGDRRKPQFDLSVLQEMRRALTSGEEVPPQVREIVDRVRELLAIPENISREEFPETIIDLQNKYPNLWNQPGKIGLVYGGVTKVKQYVFEDAKLPDIRGASALLDRINLVDLPAFFGKRPESASDKIQSLEVKKWLDKNFTGVPKLSEALISEMIVYSTGGNILAFCPAAFVNELTDAIEKRYSHETITANSCAVGDTFKLLEIRFGLLRDQIEETFWLDKYRPEYKNPVVAAYFGKLDKESNQPVYSSHIEEAFINRKSFNELTTKLAVMFNQRRSGNDFEGNDVEKRPSRRYPPMLETHPYLQRDQSDRRSAITRATDNGSQKGLPGNPWFSEVSARKRKAGDRAKKGTIKDTHWYAEWRPDVIEGWVDKFEDFLEKHPEKLQKYCGDNDLETVEVAQSLTQLGSLSKGFVAYIYADGNNMGGYIQKITTPQKYQDFSEDVDNATKYAVYQALAEHLHPRQVKENNKSESTLPDGAWIHPFEIITIGGDDIILIVPADRALAIAKTIGEQFEQILLKQVQIPGVEIKGNYETKTQPEKPIDLSKCHRYLSQNAAASKCQLSTSIGVLIADQKTPIYYAKKLYEQLLKSAKKRAKDLKKHGYCGGTVDFLVMKSVTALSSSIEDFRKEALTKDSPQELKLYAAPYTLHEIGGLIESVKALKEAEFPKSQLYQIRSFLEQGKNTTILNYRYFRTRLKDGNSEILKKEFEEAWCKPKNAENYGNLAPWMSVIEENKRTVYETIWREIVDIYDFIELEDSQLSSESSAEAEVES
ncbi:MAG: type III-B CRISPR-associated protein Cas10/Cmr2 [Oscillatoriales cyanobacterium]|uniref:type III-B CRISPR-associated protein Cas10/Cmr2 n=2 Tax=unclassified Microcoleus TaxID=2642155 RepID=UPI001D326B1E|nr:MULTISPECIES: type III-B CRISPR-associated protein Cas10/Cmr2 [unclassified Microcoleus]TAE16886.1 MAG: type III-B CRISPR-associated protein Cas10/Cmr2 [Oscillatoriales cyanobacterium]TAE28483.1 MAG: type III-B CRISPR-associated protein Cas10/Cmr2 [Oscillatoriales cyanobacterium]TAE45234.1 MAG: type III-B CRISPR-associated protein Cas10/Cmr2 [Oscillatoriales cyanobacterium]